MINKELIRAAMEAFPKALPQSVSVRYDESPEEEWINGHYYKEMPTNMFFKDFFAGFLEGLSTPTDKPKKKNK